MENQTETPFVREDRYLVLKRKDLATLPPTSQNALNDWLDDHFQTLPTREYVVVESDWPEYETVFKMIEARVTGSAALLQSTALPDHPEQHLDMAAEIRDLFPVPAPCSALEPAWAEAMANPASVPAYVRACLDARPVGERDRTIVSLPIPASASDLKSDIAELIQSHKYKGLRSIEVLGVFQFLGAEIISGSNS